MEGLYSNVLDLSRGMALVKIRGEQRSEKTRGLINVQTMTLLKPS